MSLSPERENRVDWRVRLWDYLSPRLIGEPAEKGVAFDMVSAGIHAAHAEGVTDAAYIIDQLREAVSDKAEIRILGIVSNALTELRRLNEKDFYKRSASPEQGAEE